MPARAGNPTMAWVIGLAAALPAETPADGEAELDAAPIAPPERARAASEKEPVKMTAGSVEQARTLANAGERENRLWMVVAQHKVFPKCEYLARRGCPAGVSLYCIIPIPKTNT